jgi:hypothetical protein
MFRKTWKTIKILLIILVIVICVPHSLLPKKESKDKKQELKSSQTERGTGASKTAISDTLSEISSKKDLSR